MKNKHIKQYASLLIAIAFFSNTCGAQQLNAAKVPAAVKASFHKIFPGVALVKWELEDKNYEAGFKQGRKTMSAVLDANGHLIETETGITVSALPPAVKNYIQLHYKTGAIKEAAIITKANGVIEYEAEINRMDVLFNANGEFIKETKD